MNIGVLALQGAFREHVSILRDLGVEAYEVRRPEQLQSLDGLILPGGESTTIGKLAGLCGLLDPIRALVAADIPVWGTCAGLILLAKRISGEPSHLGLMDVTVRRNAFGRQVESFHTDLDMACLDTEATGKPRPFRAIFIRAPRIESAGPEVEALAQLDDGSIVAARQDNLVVTSFHPELTSDTRFHLFFLDMADHKRRRRAPL